MEFRWALVACAGVLVFGTLKGIVVAIIVSMIGLASQAASPRVSVIGRKRGADVLRPLSPEHPDDETFEGLLIVRPEGRLFFANAQNVAERIGALIAEHQPRVLALDMSRVPDVEYSALRALMEGEENAAGRGVVFWLVGLNPAVLEVVRRAGLYDRLGRDRMLFNARAAIERYRPCRPPAGPRRVERPDQGEGREMKVPILLLVAGCLPAVAAADEVFLKGGGQLSGRIVSRTATTVEVDVGAGRIGVPASSVVRIEEGRSPLQEYEERAGRLAAGDVGRLGRPGAVGRGPRPRDAGARGLPSRARPPRPTTRARTRRSAT